MASASRDDPGGRGGSRRGPPPHLGTDPFSLDHQGNYRREVLQDAGGPAAVLGAGPNRGGSTADLRVGRREDRPASQGPRPGRPRPFGPGRGERLMAVRPEVLEGIGSGYENAVMVFIDDEGYPVSVATAF